ncbi:MAG: sigma-70 family RNA polymerase sigma factor, partial [Planctomycetes bacterium]|nr:sigma-70 family RNA polymerase sigma factor [Planctomycetota bacterium]
MDGETRVVEENGVLGDVQSRDAERAVEVVAQSHADRLLEAVYQELRSMAHAMAARERSDRTIQATDLVHEAYLRLFGKSASEWNSRAHFFSAAAQAMRRILVEQARRHATARRGGGRQREPIDDVTITVSVQEVDLLALDEALDRLEREDPTKAALVKLRYFTGMTIPQVAEALDISPKTADRYWAYSRVQL